jgi:hypothetical protein
LDSKFVDAALTTTYERSVGKQQDDIFVHDKRGIAGFSLASANDEVFAKLGSRLASESLESIARGK